MRSIRSLLARCEEVAVILGFRAGGCQRTGRSGTPKLLHSCRSACGPSMRQGRRVRSTTLVGRLRFAVLRQDP